MKKFWKHISNKIMTKEQMKSISFKIIKIGFKGWRLYKLSTWILKGLRFLKDLLFDEETGSWLDLIDFIVDNI